MSQCVCMESMGWRQRGGSQQTYQVSFIDIPYKNRTFLQMNHSNVSVCIYEVDGVATIWRLPRIPTIQGSFVNVPCKNNFLLPTNHGNVSVCMCGVATMRMLPELSEKMLTFLGFRQFIYEMAGINCVCIYVSIF